LSDFLDGLLWVISNGISQLTVKNLFFRVFEARLDIAANTIGGQKLSLELWTIPECFADVWVEKRVLPLATNQGYEAQHQQSHEKVMICFNG